MNGVGEREGLGVAWDAWPIHRELIRLTVDRSRFRVKRTIDRLRSPRRIIATTLAILFFAVYLLNGIFILSAREPADPERLRLWLSGGMVIYAIYHCVRCAWSKAVVDLELTATEQLWLGGAPIKRSSLAIYHVGNSIVAAGLKTLLLAVVLAIDVEHFELLLVGVFASLVLLETSRLIIARWSSGLSNRGRVYFRTAATLIALSVGTQVVARLVAMTPAGSDTFVYVYHLFRCLGETAASDAVQWLSLLWIPGAHLVVTDHYETLTILQFIATVSTFPLMILTLIRVDAWSMKKVLQREQQRLADADFHGDSRLDEVAIASLHTSWMQRIGRHVPLWGQDIVAVMERQWSTVVRYRNTLLFSFAIPTLLCLSPLMTGQINQQWFFVVGGIALCTMLLAPPALRIDFRRDLQRMMLLRGLPIKPSSMVVGQLAFPIMVTWMFQWISIAVAAIVVAPGLLQVLMWTGLLNALAVFTFAVENALFLAYPHHERAEGVAMMIRAKLTFFGKATVIALSLGLLVGWSVLCRQWFAEPFALIAFAGGAVLAAWTIAAASLSVATSCWRRFEFVSDTPPE